MRPWFIRLWVECPIVSPRPTAFGVDAYRCTHFVQREILLSKGSAWIGGAFGLAGLVLVTVVRCPLAITEPIISYPYHPARGVDVRGHGYVPNPPFARAEHLSRCR